METKNQEYLQAKDVLKTPEKYHELDIASASNYCRGYEDATTSQQQTIERLRERASILLSRLEGRKPKNGYIFPVRIAIQDLQTVIEEAEQLFNTTEPIDQ